MTDLQNQVGGNSIPFPGTDLAQASGCKCPVIDNGRGKGYLADYQQYGWVIMGNCPLHTSETWLRQTHPIE